MSMISDAPADIDAWLHTQVMAGQTIVIPHVKSAKNRDMRYRIVVTNKGASGTSRISQGGNVHVNAGQAAALARTSVDVKPDAACSIELELTEPGHPPRIFRFECPR